MPATAARPAPRDLLPRRRSRSPLLALLLLTLFGALAAVTAPVLAVPPAAVRIADTTDAVDDAQLEEHLATVDFRGEVALVVLILDVTELGQSASEDSALNDAVLEHARTADRSLLSADGTHFADGTVILALDTSHRFLGTYAGEDVKLAESGFEAVQDAMREDARDAQWEQSVLAGAEKYAALLGRPWWQHPGALVVALVAALAAAGLAALRLTRRTEARRQVDEALPRYREVLARREITDAAARTLPVSSPYARAALAEHERFGERIAAAEGFHAELPVPTLRRWSWGLRSAEIGLARDFARTVRRLDDADDRIIAAGDLLHRLGAWREAWELELAPLQDSVGALGQLLAEREEMSEPELRAALAVQDLGREIEVELGDLTRRLDEDLLDPESALEQLDSLTRELEASVTALQELRLDRLAEDEDEREVMRAATGEIDGSDYRSLRARRAAWDEGAGSDSLHHLSPVLWYTSWSRQSEAALDAHRNPPSSGGSGSSSTFSAGGFSGAGSSSRF